MSICGTKRDGVGADEGSVLCGICCCSRMLDHHHIFVGGLTAEVNSSESMKIYPKHATTPSQTLCRLCENIIKVDV